MRSTSPIEKPSSRLRRIAHEAELRRARAWRDTQAPLQRVACVVDSETTEQQQVLAELKVIRSLLEGANAGRPVLDRVETAGLISRAEIEALESRSACRSDIRL